MSESGKPKNKFKFEWLGGRGSYFVDVPDKTSMCVSKYGDKWGWYVNTGWGCRDPIKGFADSRKDAQMEAERAFLQVNEKLLFTYAQCWAKLLGVELPSAGRVDQ